MDSKKVTEQRMNLIKAILASSETPMTLIDVADTLWKMDPTNPNYTYDAISDDLCKLWQKGIVTKTKCSEGMGWLVTNKFSPIQEEVDMQDTSLSNDILQVLASEDKPLYVHQIVCELKNHGAHHITEGRVQCTAERMVLDDRLEVINTRQGKMFTIKGAPIHLTPAVRHQMLMSAIYNTLCLTGNHMTSECIFGMLNTISAPQPYTAQDVEFCLNYLVDNVHVLTECIADTLFYYAAEKHPYIPEYQKEQQKYMNQQYEFNAQPLMPPWLLAQRSQQARQQVPQYAQQYCGPAALQPTEPAVAFALWLPNVTLHPQAQWIANIVEEWTRWENTRAPNAEAVPPTLLTPFLSYVDRIAYDFDVYFPTRHMQIEIIQKAFASINNIDPEQANTFGSKYQMLVTFRNQVVDFLDACTNRVDKFRPDMLSYIRSYRTFDFGTFDIFVRDIFLQFEEWIKDLANLSDKEKDADDSTPAQSS